MSFSKSWNCTSRFGECNFIFFKNSQCKLISNWTRKTVWLLTNNTKHEKIREEKVLEDISWSHIFRIRENIFENFRKKFSPLLHMRSLAHKISHCLSANHNPELRCVIALVLHVLHWCYTWAALLSQSESSNFFMCIITK